MHACIYSYMHAYYKHTGKQPMSLVENLRKSIILIILFYMKRELTFPRISSSIGIALYSIDLQWVDLTCPTADGP